MANPTKRERSVNWEKEEKDILREIIRPYLSIIENKDLSTNTNKSKMSAWTEITEKFNAANSRTREKKQIVNQWKFSKLQAKKELSKHKRETSRTGGGPKPPSPSPDILEIADMVPLEFETDTNEFNVDGVNVLSENSIIYLDHIDEVERKDEEKGLSKECEELLDSTSHLLVDRDGASYRTHGKNHHSKDTPKKSGKKTPVTLYKYLLLKNKDYFSLTSEVFFYKPSSYYISTQ